jgi:F-type H+-transporting ATPase subunit gamma
MPSLIDIRRRIRSVKNTQQITKAMKMVSAARLRKAQERVINSRPYARMLGEMLANVAAAASGDERIAAHPLLAQREEKRVLLVLVTADRGLAGAFNSNLIKAAQQFLAERGAQQIEMELVGRKGRDFFVRRDARIAGEITGISQAPKFADAEALANKIMARFTDAGIDAVYLLYNEFKSVLAQKVTLRRVLPFAVAAGGAPAKEYIFEQPAPEFMARLLPRTVQLLVWEAFVESAAAELAARMTAMESATNNASEVITKLTLYMNQVRQASITREIIEVVSGASALE